jgi:hypothetical protein
MCEFVSWLEPMTIVDEYYHGLTSKQPTPEEIMENSNPNKLKTVFFLTDYMFWNTAQGKKVRDYDSGMNQENSANGHGALKAFYEFSDSAFRKFTRREYTCFKDPSKFPVEIVSAIKEFKMVRMSKGNCWENLLDLLTPKLRKEVLEENNKYNRSCNSNNYETPDFSIDCIKKLEFKRFVSKKIKQEVIEKLIRIREKCEAGISNQYGGSDSFLQFFHWSSTLEGKAYWYKINQMDIFKALPKSIPDEKKYERFYWHDRIWELFKDVNNRNPLWV